MVVLGPVTLYGNFLGRNGPMAAAAWTACAGSVLVPGAVEGEIVSATWGAWSVWSIGRDGAGIGRVWIDW